MSDYSRDEMMTVAAARMLWDGCVCFVGIGLPSAACNLARLTHAPGLVLIYESGTIGTRPTVVVTDVGILKPLPGGELALVASYPGIPAEEARAAIGWPLAVAPQIEAIAAPTMTELAALRALEARTAAAHREPVRLPI